MVQMDIYENMLGEVTWQLLIVMQNLHWKTSNMKTGNLCGIRLNRFLIIAYLFTLQTWQQPEITITSVFLTI